MKNLCSKLILLLCLTVLLTGLCACGDGLSREEREALAAEYAKTELSLAVDDPEGLAVLEHYTQLEKLDLSGSSCYEAIEKYIAAHPDVDVSYTLLLGSDGLTVGSRAESALLEKGEYVAALASYGPYLHDLRVIAISDPAFTTADLAALAAAFPEADILFRISPEQPDIPFTAAELDLSALRPENADAAAGFLEKMPALARVNMTAADGTNLLSFTELKMLQDAAPGAVFDYRFDSFGRTVSTADEYVEYGVDPRAYIYNAGLEQIREMMPCMTRLKSMYFQYCQIDYDVLARFRDDFPGVDIVWRIDFGPYSCRTDTERIFANGSLDGNSVYNLRYCTKVKYLDLGHNNQLSNIDFAAFMPDLEIAILADTAIRDISPLANCPKLRYLEIFVTSISDLSPLASCTELEHLNVSCCFSLRDLSPLFGLTKLKRLWNTFTNVPKSQRDEIMALMPDCSFCFDRITSTGKGWRFDDKGNINEYYAEVYEIFGYDDWRENISYW